MDLFKLVNIVDEEFTKHGLWDKRWYFKFDRSLRRFGQCNFTRKTIFLSKNLCKLYDEDKVVNTLRHEIAHALVGVGHGHDTVWKQKAIEIGGDGKRLYQITINNYKWKANCECMSHYRYRKTKDDSLRCSLCKTNLTWEKI